ncbi:hypothetical protein SLS53_005723 [Cytospora paraplurivora]|uniref:Uncharacterized protein n=1 Tax=Cytospora paraplurivora TaxID=2898453 RepID=A0AAN9YG30_9PEZI
MDNLIKSFMRVVRKLDNADELIQSFPEWERSVFSQDVALSSSLTPQDQRRILDFPDPDTQAANIAKSSTLAKEDLLKRAAETPSRLSDTEISLLRNRYWLDISPDEKKAVMHAQGLLSGPSRISEDEYKQAEERLKTVRRPLYAENEEKAIDNALGEDLRREKDAWRASQKQEAEKALTRAFPWVRRLWEEDIQGGEKHWGYGIFIDPEAFSDGEEAERYMDRRDGVLSHAHGAVGTSISAIRNKWRLQRLDWPTDATAGDGEKEGGSQTALNSDDKEDSSGPAGDAVPSVRTGGPRLLVRKERTEEEGADEKRAVKFQKLREQFRSVRDRAPKRQRQEHTTLSAPTQQAERGGLLDGILQNVFLVVDKFSAGTVYSESVYPGQGISGYGLVDDIWLWAVDPEYDYDDAANDAPAAAAATTTIEGPTTSTGTPRSRYRGFMRVRLQQIVNNFYDARRFHESDYPMEKIWEAAQKSMHQAFVSLRDDEARSWSQDRFIGSAMRAQPPRVVLGQPASFHGIK